MVPVKENWMLLSKIRKLDQQGVVEMRLLPSSDKFAFSRFGKFKVVLVHRQWDHSCDRFWVPAFGKSFTRRHLRNQVL